jgi:hypothetical protein
MTATVEQELPPIDKFHAHLDECEQCRSNPFRLCPKGEQLLQAVGR